MSRLFMYNKFLLWKALHPEKIVCNYCKAKETPYCTTVKKWSIFRFSCYENTKKGTKWIHNYSLTNKLSEFKNTTRIDFFCLKFLIPEFYKKPEE